MDRGIRGSVVALVLLVAAAAAAAALAADPPAAGEPPSGCICEQGQRQSPIDLGGAAAAELPAIRFRYGETVAAEVFDTGKTVEVEFPPDRRPWIAIRGERFELLQFHFHRPSEHRIGSEEYPMELHFVHQNQVGELAVVGVFLDGAAGEPQPVIARIWATVPEEVGERAEIRLSPAGLLPRDRSYVRYAGSLTTGRCSEGVRWHVLRGRLAVTPRQVEDFRHPNSARSVQPLNGRPVLVGG